MENSDWEEEARPSPPGNAWYMETAMSSDDRQGAGRDKMIQVDRMRFGADNLYIGEDKLTEAGKAFGYNLYSSDEVAQWLTDQKLPTAVCNTLNACMVDVLALPTAVTQMTNGTVKVADQAVAMEHFVDTVKGFMVAVNRSPVAIPLPSMAGIQICNKMSLGRVTTLDQKLALHNTPCKMYHGMTESVIQALVSVYKDDGLGPTESRIRAQTCFSYKIAKPTFD
eukprot:14323313-Ditylum_brightwellii.AAC.1